MIFLVALLVYAWTLCPTVAFGDSGELVAAAHTLGLAHPTGYPLYLLLVKLFSLVLPLGSVAWRANLFSALCAAAAAQVLGTSIRRLTDSRWAGHGAGLSCAFLAPLWEQATVARVYPLSALCSALLILCLVRYWLEPERRLWYRHNLLLGFALANHTMVIVHLPLFLLAVLRRRPAELARPRAWLLSLLLLLPGLSLYAYLPLRAAQDPALSWRVPVQDDAGARYETLEHPASLWSYLRRDMHHGRRWCRSLEDAGVIARHHAREAFEEIGVVGLILVLLGIAGAWRRGAVGLWLGGILLWASNLALLGWHGAHWDVFLYPRYMATGFLALAFLMGMGLGFVEHGFGAALARPRIGAALVLLPALFYAVSGFGRCDRREETLAEDYGRAILAELPRDCQLYSTMDASLYPLLYLTLVEGERPDLELVNPLHFARQIDLSHDTLSRPDTRALFTTDVRLGPGQAGLPRLQHGLTDRIVKPAELSPPAPFTIPELPGLSRAERSGPFEASAAALIHANLAEALAARGREEEARERLRSLREIEAGRPWGHFAGVELCLKMGLPELGLELLERARTFGDPREPAQVTYRARLVRLRKGLDAAEQARAAGPGEAALELWKTASELAPRHVPTQAGYVDHLAAAGRKREAREAAETAWRRQPSDPDLYALYLTTMRRP